VREAGVPKRPLAATVVAVLNICFGVVGFAWVFLVLVGVDVIAPLWAAVYALGYTSIKSAALLLSGVGLLLSRRWGRSLLLVCGWWGLLEAIAGLFLWGGVTLVMEREVAVQDVALLGVQTALRVLFASVDLVVGYLPSVRRFFLEVSPDVETTLEPTA
jgi:hypothetical protein